MRKKNLGYSLEGISTHEIAETIVDLLSQVPNDADLSQTHSKLKCMHEQINKELKSFFEDGKCLPIVVDSKKDWCIHNFAKAETRGAIVESLLHFLEQRLSTTAEIQDAR